MILLVGTQHFKEFLLCKSQGRIEVNVFAYENEVLEVQKINIFLIKLSGM